jgi:hypothetical protein
MGQHETEVVARKKCIVMDKATLLEKGIKIPNPKRFMWT